MQTSVGGSGSRRSRKKPALARGAPASVDADSLFKQYRRLLQLAKPEIVPYPSQYLVRENRHLIRHAADVPVFLSAMASKPDWLLTNNTNHFTAAVAQRASVRIATPAEFFRVLSGLFS